MPQVALNQNWIRTKDLSSTEGSVRCSGRRRQPLGDAALGRGRVRKTCRREDVVASRRRRRRRVRQRIDAGALGLLHRQAGNWNWRFIQPPGEEAIADS